MRLNGRALRWMMASVLLCASSAYANQNEPEAVPGEYIVKLRTPISEDKETFNYFSERLGAVVKSAIPSFNILVIQRPVFEKSESVKKILAEDELVEYVEPNLIYRISRTPNDPMYGQLWGMKNKNKPGIDIGAEAAWDIETGDKNLVVAVIDTGINYNHPDLKDNLWTNTAELNGKPGVDDDGNGVVDDIYGYNAAAQTGDPLDDHGHGSHCAGTIGASGNDGKGIVGVAWNVKLMGVKFLTASGGGSLDGAIRAVDYATKMGAKILSNSWGGGGFSQALKEAIERSDAAGALFVAAAGNDSNNNDSRPTYPATYDVPNVLSVAAIDSNGNLASFSNYGRTKVHVAAPGVGITSANKNGTYDTWSGTSMACPHVSGIAALLFSHDRGLSSHEVKQRIVSTAQRVSSLRNRVRSGGIANAHTALINRVPAADPNDPTTWSTMSVQVSSPRPYRANFTETYQIEVPGATMVSVFFEKFDTEKDYDVVTVKDGSGQIVEKLSGQLDGTYSLPVSGSKVILEFKSDGSVQGQGFDVTRAAWK